MMIKFDGITTCLYGSNAFKVYESEMLMVRDIFFEKLQWNSVETINTCLKSTSCSQHMKNDQLW